MGDVVKAPHPALAALAVTLSPLVTPLWLLLCFGLWS